MHLLLLNSHFGCVTVLMMDILCGILLDLKVSQAVSQGMWQKQRAHQSIKLYEFDVHIFALEDEIEEN